MKKIALPNGTTIDCISRRDARLIYEDIFVHDCYRKGGVAIRPGDVIVDVGANIGLFEVFIDEVAKGSTVYAIEPAIQPYLALCHNGAKLKGTNVSAICGAAGAVGRNDLRQMSYYPRMPSASSLEPIDLVATRSRDHRYVRDQMPLGLGYIAPEWLVEAIRRWHLREHRIDCVAFSLPLFLTGRGIRRVDLLKIDAEGSEWAIVDSMGDEDWEKVRQVIVEVHGGARDAHKMLGVLAARGFRATRLPNPAIPSLDIIYGVK